MKAAVLYEACKPLQIEELEMPDVGDDDVLIRVAACGVCPSSVEGEENNDMRETPIMLFD